MCHCQLNPIEVFTLSVSKSSQQMLHTLIGGPGCLLNEWQTRMISGGIIDQWVDRAHPSLDMIPGEGMFIFDLPPPPLSICGDVRSATWCAYCTDKSRAFTIAAPHEHSLCKRRGEL